jgi:hypothetical protein
MTMLPLPVTSVVGHEPIFNLGIRTSEGRTGAMSLITERTGRLNRARTYSVSEAWDCLKGESPMATEFP